MFGIFFASRSGNSQSLRQLSHLCVVRRDVLVVATAIGVQIRIPAIGGFLPKSVLLLRITAIAVLIIITISASKCLASVHIRGSGATKGMAPTAAG